MFRDIDIIEKHLLASDAKKGPSHIFRILFRNLFEACFDEAQINQFIFSPISFQDPPIEN